MIKILTPCIQDVMLVLGHLEFNYSNTLVYYISLMFDTCTGMHLQGSARLVEEFIKLLEYI